MTYANRPRNLRWLPRTRVRRARSFVGVWIACAVVLATSSGCVTRRIVWSECPHPSPAEAQDVSDWLIEEPERPAQDWAARVIGHLYDDELREVRGEPDPD